MYVTIEETRNKEVWVDTDDFYEAIEIAESVYKDGGYDMRSEYGGAVEVHALVGDAEHDFVEIAEWFC